MTEFVLVRPARRIDVYEAASRAKQFYFLEDDFVDWCLDAVDHGVAFALSPAGGRPAIIAGGALLSRSVATCWAIVTEDIHKYPKALTRAMKVLIQDMATQYNLHRMEIVVRADNKVAAKWAKHIGFEAEGLLRQFGSDRSDHLIFGRIW